MRRLALIVVAAAALAMSGAPVGAQEGAASSEVAAPAIAPPPAPLPPAVFPMAADPPAIAAPSQRVPIVRRWWFWAALGTAAVGVIAAGILLTPADPYSGNASPGTVTVF